MAHELPLDERPRRMNLFDSKSGAIEGIDYIEEILESGINITDKHEKHTYTPLVFPLLKTDEFTKEDYENSKVIVCLTCADACKLSEFLRMFFCNFTVKSSATEEKGHLIVFSVDTDATACLHVGNENFSFFRPKNYVEVPGSRDIRFCGSKYCTEVPPSPDKVLLGPVDVAPSILRDCLDEIAPLQSFRPCTLPKYFVFTFRDADFADAFVKTTSHIFITDQGRSLISKKAYIGCSILNFTRNTPNLAPRRMGGSIAVSKERTRVVLLLNAIGPWDMDVESVLNDIKEKSVKCGDIRNIIAPGHGRSSIIEHQGCSKIFVECGDLETSQNVYDEFGGLVFDGRIVVTGYYPESNYFSGEYE